VLANFPKAVYLLAFDRKTVAQALSATLGMDGGAYLEKIVQAPFSLPALDRERLTQKLFEKLEARGSPCRDRPARLHEVHLLDRLR